MKAESVRIPVVVQWDLMLSLQWLGLLLRHGFDLPPENFYMLWVLEKQNKTKPERARKIRSFLEPPEGMQPHGPTLDL